ncbi:MAG: hypothetical protein F7B61_06775 [Caldisphaeraceae archaeon]|nr:hypothetical protein [Caldisphaeraceae archaeon]
MSGEWYEKLDLSKIGDEDRYKLLDYVIGKKCKAEVQRALDISRVMMWRSMNRQSKIDDNRLKILLLLISEKEFREVLGTTKLLRSMGIVKEDVNKVMGLFPSDVVLSWDQGFEGFLREYKKKKVKREDTTKYYKNLFEEKVVVYKRSLTA